MAEPFDLGTLVEHGGHVFRVSGIGGNLDGTYMHCAFAYVGPVAQPEPLAEGDTSRVNLADCEGEGDECYVHGDACKAERE